jgi:hypothetical protein
MSKISSQDDQVNGVHLLAGSIQAESVRSTIGEPLRGMQGVLSRFIETESGNPD